MHTINCLGLGRVVASNHPDYQKNDIVHGTINWAEYTIVKTQDMLKKLDTIEFPLSYYVGIFGFSGLTAYGGFFKICKPKKEDKVFVSAAAGSVGNLVGQYAKLFGCYVVGCAGTKQKVNFLKEKLGFDEAFNYKEETDLNSTLQRYFPDGIDIYFDNVGGEMLEAVVANMNAFGRIAACGVLSGYTNSKKHIALSMVDVVYKRIMIHGFLATDFTSNDFNDFMSVTKDYVRAGKLSVPEDISFGIETIPSAFVGLFRGDNVGKKIVQIAKE
ncbi:putative 2-alkenal reductase (NAD(P)(+)) [Helianthus annuus]|uniref:2-alkenal reductase (NAD(P)(+)) n=1 Tax=Helianthus annuus TaxID=4232 RepID=A0A9K3JLA8_HELAN|nr:putative 2-alkenal reductase (NAD(P)(+)) [Helianthus annuus]KAJ0613840.1 putative 2-alkenal reductase (NAD(P)(+)) [Helianthus annuus]KAJ0938555.1 putative 2-alkenal reductase (NAD(P)(+)) [Helianthus annuus]KAJ0950535.1 putative 2-alkenal reductase (NAD(P)(+)) [Helianthus annuus]